MTYGILWTLDQIYRTMHVFMFSGREDGLVKSFCLMVPPLGIGAGVTVGTWKYV